MGVLDHKKSMIQAKPPVFMAVGLLADPFEASLISTSQLGTCSFFPYSYSALVCL
jgi:hypothetical protein